MIYFARPVGCKFIKIGYSRNPEQRKRTLEYQYKRHVVMLGEMGGNRNMERIIHGLFIYLRIGQTEHFRQAPELMAFIKSRKRHNKFWDNFTSH